MFISHKTVINKTFIYSDTVLSPNEVCDNLHVSFVSNVNEDELDKCLNVIFKSNPNIVFNTIQYAKNTRKVYFYTDGILKTDAWDNLKIQKYNKLSSNEKIYNEIQNILCYEDELDESCISLFDISKIIKYHKANYDKCCETAQRKLSDLLSLRTKKEQSIIVYGMNFNTQELRIGVKGYSDYNLITFAKNDNDLYISSSATSSAYEILSLIGLELSKLYDALLSYIDFKKQYCYRVKSVNSNFLVNISEHGVNLIKRDESKIFLNDFELSSLSYEDKFKFVCNSHEVLESIKGREEEIFKKVFVFISDCPEWSRDNLQEIRINQLNGNNKNE